LLFIQNQSVFKVSKLTGSSLPALRFPSNKSQRQWRTPGWSHLNIFFSIRNTFSDFRFQFHSSSCLQVRPEVEEQKNMGGNSQNFLSKFVRFFLTLGPKFLRLKWLKVVFKQTSIKVNVNYCINQRFSTFFKSRNLYIIINFIAEPWHST